MLCHTFSHIRGIGPKAEHKLWRAGILDWQKFLDTPNIPIPAAKIPAARSQLQASRTALAERDYGFFTGLLPASEHWRLFPEFKARAAYVDIETTGLSAGYNEITTIALYDGRTIRYYINGHNLANFPDDIRAYDLLITYNGKCFDIPFIESFFRIRCHQAHIDLRHMLKNLGITGGLKGCEKQFGLDRAGLDGVDGYFAVLLWQQYQATRQDSALETLLAYNIEDVLNLETLMHEAYNRKISRLSEAPARFLQIPEKPATPFSPDKHLIDQLKYHHRGLI